MTFSDVLLPSFLALSLLGCDGREHPAPQAIRAGLTIGAVLRSFEAEWKLRTADEMTTRISSLAGVVLGQTPETVDASVVDAAVKSHAQEVVWTEKLALPRPLVVLSFSDKDDIKVSNAGVEDDVAVDGDDIGEQGARAVAADAIARLTKYGLIDTNAFDLTQAVVSHLMHGASPGNEQPTPKILQYRFVMNRLIDGLPFLNSGLVIMVHRNGQIASIRVGGASVHSSVQAGVEQPTGNGSAFNAATTVDAINKRFWSEHPDAVGVKSRTFYAFRGGEGSGLIEPRQVVLYSRQYTVADGRTAITKGRYLSYSFQSATDEPEVLDGAPVASPTGDVPTRLRQ